MGACEFSLLPFAPLWCTGRILFSSWILFVPLVITVVISTPFSKAAKIPTTLLPARSCFLRIALDAGNNPLCPCCWDLTPSSLFCSCLGNPPGLFLPFIRSFTLLEGSFGKSVFPFVPPPPLRGRSVSDFVVCVMIGIFFSSRFKRILTHLPPLQVSEFVLWLLTIGSETGCHSSFSLSRFGNLLFASPPPCLDQDLPLFFFPPSPLLVCSSPRWAFGSGPYKFSFSHSFRDGPRFVMPDPHLPLAWSSY